MQLAIILLLILNGSAAIVTASDKRRARRGLRRVPERVLWILALCGGALGMYVTMRSIRHKTKHWQFMWGLPLVILLQAAAVWLLHDGIFAAQTFKNILH